MNFIQFCGNIINYLRYMAKVPDISGMNGFDVICFIPAEDSSFRRKQLVITTVKLLSVISDNKTSHYQTNQVNGKLELKK